MREGQRSVCRVRKQRVGQKHRVWTGTLLFLLTFAGAQSPTFTVRAGDTLYSIAVRSGTTIDTLQTLNPNIGTFLQPGDSLALPETATYTLQMGESLASVAEQFGLTLEGLIAANNLQSSTVNPGTVLALSSPRTTPQTYTVKEGDTLYDVALSFDSDVNTLISLNNLEGQLIRPGQTLVISGTPPQIPEAPLAVTVQPGDSLWSIARIHDITVADLQAANNLGETTTLDAGATLLIPGHFSPDTHDVGAGATREIVVQKGDTLTEIAQRYNTSVAALVSANNLSNTDIQAGDALRIIPSEELAPAASGNRTASVTLQWPLNGQITSPFGYRSLRVNGSNFHNALDIDGVTGDPVKAAAPGVVTFSGWHGSYGNLVTVQAGDVEYRYAHNSELLVSVGQQVNVGDVIALVGNTGLSFGDHLHFEVRIGNTPVDPLPMLTSN
jgi:murein DD-endopeptidase MepM/ murein hydrolase activator NlpD